MHRIGGDYGIESMHKIGDSVIVDVNIMGDYGIAKVHRRGA